MNNQLTHTPSHCYQTCLNRQAVNSLWSAIQNSAHQIVESKFLLYIVRTVFCDTGRLAWADPNPIKAFFAKFLQSPQVRCLYMLIYLLRSDAYIRSLWSLASLLSSTFLYCVVCFIINYASLGKAAIGEVKVMVFFCYVREMVVILVFCMIQSYLAKERRGCTEKVLQSWFYKHLAS